MSMIELRSVGGGAPPIVLGEVDLGLTDGASDPMMLMLFNRDMRPRAEIRVSTRGNASSSVELARDLNGEPGNWEGDIIARAGVLQPNASCSFWVRAVPNETLKVGDQGFEFVVKSIAMIEE